MAISAIAESYVLNVTATDVTGTEPTGTAENDLVIALVGTTDDTGVWTDPADFTEIGQASGLSGSPDMRCYIGYKVRAATAGSGYAWTFGGAAGGCTCTLLTLRGIDTSFPIDTTYVEGSHFNDGTINTPNEAASPILTVTANAWAVILSLYTQGISGAAAVPSGYTEQADHLTSATTSRGTYICSKLIPSITTETPGAFTHTDVTGTSENRSFIIAIRPAAASASKLSVLKRIRHF